MRPAVKRARDGNEKGVAMFETTRAIAERAASMPDNTFGLVEIDALVIRLLRQYSMPALRISLGLVFLWFGALKLFGISPVLTMVKQTYSFLPMAPFFFALSIWEIGIGCGLIFKRVLRFTLVLLLLHLTGTFMAIVQSPSLFFLHDNPLWLTTEGEFVVKNVVLVAAALVIGAYELRPRNGVRRSFTLHTK
jgi:putative oxidoreductase